MGSEMCIRDRSTLAITIATCRIKIGANDLVDVDESELYAQINFAENLMRTRASRLMKASSLAESYSECIWSDMFIARVPSNKIDTCSVSISIIDARGNGGQGKMISFLDGITLTDLIKMDAKSLTSGTIPSSTIKMPNGVEIHVSFEGYGTDKSSGSSLLLSSRTRQISSGKSKSGFAATILSRKNSEDIYSATPLYYLSLHPKGPWLSLIHI